MATTINPHSFGRRLAREAIRKGKSLGNFKRLNKLADAPLAKVTSISVRKKFAGMAREFKKKG